MGVNGNANASEVLPQDVSSREASTSGRWITPFFLKEERQMVEAFMCAKTPGTIS